MSSLAAKCDYLEKFACKVIPSQQLEPRKRAYVPYKRSSSEDGPSKKKNKQKPNVTQKNQKGKQSASKTHKTQDSSLVQKRTNTVFQGAAKHEALKDMTPRKTSGEVVTQGSQFSARDLLRQRLHQKIEETRGLGPHIDPSSEEVKKRRERRKQERERKKRKKKEFRAKKLAAEKAAVENEGDHKEVLETQPAPTSEKLGQQNTISVLFSKVEVGEDSVDKVSQKKLKRKQVKGGLTPLTGRNYKQLLTRVQARTAKLEELKLKDSAKAQKVEEKMKWTNMLYKAEGLKIKDNEDMLKASLKKKEKRKAQVKKKWTQRSHQVLEKMQRRQDKRRRNLQKRNQGKTDKRKERARKKGRVLPEDLK